MTQEKILCIYHGPCADGFTAAWVVNKSMPDVEFRMGVYGEEPPDVIGRHVLMVDFSYKRHVLEDMAKIAKSITILDHHKTAAEDLAGYPTFADAAHWVDRINEDLTGIHAVFDMGRSGAGLTWDFFHPGKNRPALVTYVEDRDLWKFAQPNSREVSAFIFSNDYTFENWDYIANTMHTVEGLIGVVQQGDAIERKQAKDTRELIKQTKRRLKIGGYVVWAANLPYIYASDAGNIMSEGEPFAATYFDKDGVRSFSLRSKPEGADVQAIAKQYGGGGHNNAAGFTISLSEISQFEVGYA